MASDNKQLLPGFGVTKMQLAKWFVLVIFAIAIFLVPESTFWTSQMKWFFIITVDAILALAFELIPVLAIGILAPALYFVCGVGTMGEALSGWTNSGFWMCFGSFTFAYALQECGILERFSLFIITKFCRGSVQRLVYLLLLIGAVLNIVTICGAFVLMIMFTYGIVMNMNKPVGKQTAYVMMCGFIGAYGTNRIGYVSTQMAVIVQSVENVLPGVHHISILTPLIYNFLYLLVCVIAFWIMGKVYGVKDMDFGGSMDYLVEKRASLGKLSTQEKKGLVYGAVIVALLLTTTWTGLNSTKILMTLPFLGLLPGLNLIDQKVLNKLPMSTMFFIPLCLSFGSMGTSLGVGTAISNLIMPYMEGRGAISFMAIIFLAGFLTNKILTPMAIISMFTLPVCNLAVSMGFDPLAASMMLYASGDAYLFPWESSMTLLVYSSGVMSFADFVKLQGIKTAVLFVVFVFLATPLWGIIGLLHL